MHQRRWLARLGLPLIAILVAGGVIALAQPPAKAGGAAGVTRLASCAAGQSGAAGAAHVDGPQPGTWWKTLDRVDATGALTSRQLFVGTGSTSTGAASLAVESSVAGPVDGLVVVTEDDGNHSTVRVIRVAATCETVIDERADVVRNAILDPADGSIFVHVVGRESRADLGTFRISPDGHGQWTSAEVAPPISGDLARSVGLVYGTGLAIDGSDRYLAVQSCTDLACLTRVFDLRAAPDAPMVIRGLHHGTILGFAGHDLVTWDACVGYPCALYAWDGRAGGGRQLATGATAAALTRDGRRLVASIAGATGERLAEIDVATGRSSQLRGIAAGARPIGSGPAATTGFEAGLDEVAVAIPAGDPFVLRPDSAAEEALP